MEDVYYKSSETKTTLESYFTPKAKSFDVKVCLELSV